MIEMKNPGSNSGKRGGIFQETGPRGGRYENFTTVPDNHTMPPTSAPGRSWTPVRTTPDSKR
ncbi:MAG: hypothetical protein EOP50_11860 [Sphingobacteriales bacterium]|nr:MAG: hypothetical protein EOP50_11860 [Sphingobacteriales bacterium]